MLRGVTLRVSPGEVVGLLGANGAGKSTLLRIFATLLRPNAGTVRVFGRDVVRDAERVRTLVAYMGHAPGFYDDLSARENLRFAAAMLDRDARAVDGMLERVGLSEAADERVRGFSSGMQRRLAIARLLLARPGVLLLDEPYSNLDRSGVALMSSVISERCAAGAAALVVLHELAPAEELLARAVTIVGGRVASHASATVSERFATPALAHQP